jgi:hypothetical protein
MLPNLKILICGLVFGLLLFAVTGAGVKLPDSYTRVGEMPEIGRPMMQRMIAEEPAQARFHILTVVRRSEELERLRERASLEVASASMQMELGVLKLTVISDPISDGVLGEDLGPPPYPPAHAGEGKEGAGTMSGTASGSFKVLPAKMGSDVRPDDLDRARVAALPPNSVDRDLNEPAARLMKIPRPPSRRTATINGIHRRVLHRKHRVAHAV